MSKETSNFEIYKQKYLDNWASLEIRENRFKDAREYARKLLSHKAIYLVIEDRTGVPWWFVGLCHYRECGFGLNKYLGNGQPLNKVTTEQPPGRGPFLDPDAFADGAADALCYQRLDTNKDWSIAKVLYLLEAYNGFGYRQYGVNSPYLYGGSTAYGPPESKAGKYTRDKHFDPNAVDTQLGAAVILKALLQLDPSITFGKAAVRAQNERDEHKAVDEEPARDRSEADREPGDDLSGLVVWLQASLNTLGAAPVWSRTATWVRRPTPRSRSFSDRTTFRRRAYPTRRRFSRSRARSRGLRPLRSSPMPSSPLSTGLSSR